MGTIVKLAVESAPTVDRSGLRARLVWSAGDSRKERAAKRDSATMSVRWACRPMVKAKAAKDATLEVARRAAGDILTETDLLLILYDEWELAHPRRRRR